MLRKAPIFGSSTTRTLFPLFSYDNAIFISSCIVCKYCHIVFASHFLCPKWAAARQTGSKSKSKKDLCKLLPGIFCRICYTYNVVLNTGIVPSTWNKTMFIMLAKFRSAKLPSDFRPIASVRTLYKVFTYMVLARVEPVLEANQPEEQHGFHGRRLEEHLVSANLVIDKLLAVGKPVWIVSLDLSKAFDRVNWSKLWAALTAHGVSQHLVWIIQCLYWKQEGCVKGDTDVSNCFPINSGVRQGCVLSPKLFSSVQQWAMRKWRLDVENAHYGIDLQDDLPKLLDLRSADDILLFARIAHEAVFLLENLMQEFEEVGLLLNGDKTVVLTNEAQPPSHLWTRTGIKLQVKNGSGGNKWLGCILGVGKAGRTLLEPTTTCRLLPKPSLLIKQSSVTVLCL